VPELAHRSLEHEQDRNGKGQADERVGDRVAGQHAKRAEQHGQRGEPVRAGVVAVRDQRRRPDLLADADAEDRHSLVPEKPDDGSRDDPANVLNRLRVQQAIERLPASDPRREGNHRDDEHAGQILGPAKAVGVPSGGGSTPQGEGDPEWDCGQRIREVVDRVGQQRN